MPKIQRTVLSHIQAWFLRKDRKPLILQGARQVGKTYTVNQFGRDFVETRNAGKYYYVDLAREKDLHSVFQMTHDPKKILEFIELRKNIKFNLEQDLLFLDEIQDCPLAISSLKYFEQDLKQFHLIAAGSHLGLIKNEESFPVGKVNFLSLFPISFSEFVSAGNPDLGKLLGDLVIPREGGAMKPIPEAIHQQFLELLLIYFSVGGLPEVVTQFLNLRSDSVADALKAARETQKALIFGYEADFSKYSGTVNANHIHSVFQAIPKQLARHHDESTQKFKFSGVIPNQKGFERIIGPLTWLTKSRLCIKSYIAKHSGHPLQAYTQDNLFRAFYFDVGILNAALQTPPEAIVVNDLSSYKGFIVENFVAQELFAKLDQDLVSWEEGESEIEFLVTRGKNIIPIEAKSGTRSRRAKSLESYIKRYQPTVAYKVSPQNLTQKNDSGVLVHLPLYLCSKIL